ncbi:MAG: hypothetical protein V1835_01635 [Candidatus Micrarchaeota archaeon]
MRMQLKGFIGPLGDDIPSIFPIVAGVLLFITSLMYITSQVDQRNAYLDVRAATLRMSYIATDKGYMEDLQFTSKCTNDFKPFAGKNNIEFAVILKKYCGPIKFADDENLKITRRQIDWGNGVQVPISDMICSSNASIEGVAPEDVHAANPLAFPFRDTVILSYPIAVDCGNALRGLGLISVAGWRRSSR